MCCGHSCWPSQQKIAGLVTPVGPVVQPTIKRQPLRTSGVAGKSVVIMVDDFR
jgi:hypothetical protein